METGQDAPVNIVTDRTNDNDAADKIEFIRKVVRNKPSAKKPTKKLIQILSEVRDVNSLTKIED